MLVKNITAEHVFLACGHTDMRKSIDGLAAIIQQNLKNAVTKGILWDTFCVYWNLRTGTWALIEKLNATKKL